MKDELIYIIEALCNAGGVSGFESEVQKKISEYCAGNLNCTLDSLGNIYLVSQNYNKEKPTILLEAHADEVGFVVKTISENGLLGIIPIGSIIDEVVYGGSVYVRNLDGEKIQGTITYIDPHFAKEAHVSSSKWVDIGATSKKEAENRFRVSVGQPVTPYQEFLYSEKTGVLHGKAFDNRLGCAILAYTLCRKNTNDGINVIAIVSVQEEVGSRGISYAMSNVHADLAVCLEGCPADDIIPGIEPQTIIGRGPMVRYMDRSYICKPALVKWIKETADQYDIPIQLAVRSSGGTDASVINNSFGIPSVVVGIPVRHAHSFHSISLLRDVLLTQQLCENLINTVSPEQIKRIREVF